MLATYTGREEEDECLFLNSTLGTKDRWKSPMLTRLRAAEKNQHLATIYMPTSCFQLHARNTISIFSINIHIWSLLNSAGIQTGTVCFCQRRLRLIFWEAISSGWFGGLWCSRLVCFTKAIDLQCVTPWTPQNVYRILNKTCSLHQM